jgi:glutathione synthase/RimK-type ligase-like ATP-grasp enzyme
VIERARRNDKTHLNNTSQGAPAKIVSLETIPPELRRASTKAAKILEREIAGVDILQDKNTGLWYCLEVNDGPQLASGSFIKEKNVAFAEFLQRKVEG